MRTDAASPRHRCVGSARAGPQLTELLEPAGSALAWENTTSEQSLDKLSSCRRLQGSRLADERPKGQRRSVGKKVAVLRGNSTTSRLCDTNSLHGSHKHRKAGFGLKDLFCIKLKLEGNLASND